jgi:hypothetical protein
MVSITTRTPARIRTAGMKKLTDEEFLDHLLKDHPGLTVEEALEHLKAMGKDLDLTGSKYDTKAGSADAPATNPIT